MKIKRVYTPKNISDNQNVSKKPPKVKLRHVILFFIWMLVFTVLARGVSGVLLPVVVLSNSSPNKISQEITAKGSITWKAGTILYIPSGITVENVFVSQGQNVSQGDAIAQLRVSELNQEILTMQADINQKQTNYDLLIKPVETDDYEVNKAQQALLDAYQNVKDVESEWAEKETDAAETLDNLKNQWEQLHQKDLQYTAEINDIETQLSQLQQSDPPDTEAIAQLENQLKESQFAQQQNSQLIVQLESEITAAQSELDAIPEQKEAAIQSATETAEQVEQSRNDAIHSYEENLKANEDTNTSNAADARVLAEEIKKLKNQLSELESLYEQDGILYAPSSGTLLSLQMSQGEESGTIAGTISDESQGYQIKFTLQNDVPDFSQAKLTVTQGDCSAVITNSSSQLQEDGSISVCVALPDKTWSIGAADISVSFSETEYDCCVPTSALHSDNGGDFVYTVEERNTILGLQNIIHKVYVEVIESNQDLAALRNYTTGKAVVISSSKPLREGTHVRING